MPPMPLDSRFAASCLTVPTIVAQNEPLTFPPELIDRYEGVVLCNLGIAQCNIHAVPNANHPNIPLTRSHKSELDWPAMLLGQKVWRLPARRLQVAHQANEMNQQVSLEINLVES